jgi:hypothetical protein
MTPALKRRKYACLSKRPAALWARMRLDDVKAARETADQQKCLREIGGGLVWPEPPGVHDTDRGGWKCPPIKIHGRKRIN